MRMDPPVVTPIHHHTSIQLWETDDHGRKDFFGELMLQIDFLHFAFNENQRHTFSRDKGIGGDARYTLEYIVRRRIAVRPNRPVQYRC
ncbi:MAG: hypothetical protein L6N96_06855 [Candidatus Methylarchaceae archaeon HK02M2]|nr:hypothetical protein [Candidatus Methylarchaceae archaeon HK02M2]